MIPASLDFRPKLSLGVTGSTSMPVCDFGDNAALLFNYNFLELDNLGSSHYDTNAISLKSGPIYSLSLLLMPLAFDWNEGTAGIK